MTTKTTQNSLHLPQLLENSRGFHFLIPTYQKALRDLAETGDLSLQKALAVILRREKSADLQSVYFTEEFLQNFVERNLGLTDQNALLQEYRDKAKHLVKAFMFFTVEEKAEILPYIDSLNLKGVKDLIDLYKFGHHKQDQYLQTFAEKDPKQAIKFQLLTQKLAK